MKKLPQGTEMEKMLSVEKLGQSGVPLYLMYLTKFD